MRRRAFLALFMPDSGVPTDEEKLNAFAGCYNAYVMRLRDGVIDLKLWERARRAWKKIDG